jgi:hypothetical protein
MKSKFLTSKTGVAMMIFLIFVVVAMIVISSMSGKNSSNTEKNKVLLSRPWET